MTLEPVGKILERTLVLDSGADAFSQQGYTQVPNAVLRSSAISPGAKLIYATLLTFLWSNNEVFPGQQRVADDAGMSLRSVTNHIKELQREGFLTVERRGLGKTAIYTLHVSVAGGKVRRRK